MKTVDQWVQKAAVVIPAYKPDDRLPPYVGALLEAGVGHVVVVDDGSGADYRPVFDAIPRGDRVSVIHYEPNAGKGAALRRGLRHVLESCPDQAYAITADSDGQHTVKDVLRMCEAMRNNMDGLLLGSRDFSKGNVPFKSRNGNRITSITFKLLYGRWVSDTQTGLRGMPRKLLPAMLDVRGDRYEYEMNVLIECAGHKWPIRPLPIETVYENNNDGSHFRAFRDSARIYAVIFAGFFRFISASLICFLIDYGLYLLLNNLLKNASPALGQSVRVLVFSMVPHIALATALARVISGLTNFVLNRQIVFGDHGSVRKSLPRYICVFFLIMLLSMWLTSAMHLWLGWSDNAAKIPVDVVLFFLSYYLQRKWVFRKA